MGTIVIRDANDPQGEPIVLLGRRADEVDIGLAFHAYERATSLACSLDGFHRTPFKGSDRGTRMETLVTLLTEFAVSARRYLELAGDTDLSGAKISANDDLTFRYATNRIVHGVTFIPDYSSVAAKGEEPYVRNTVLIAVSVRTDERELATIKLADLCDVFLRHKPTRLFEALEQHKRDNEEACRHAAQNLEND